MKKIILTLLLVPVFSLPAAQAQTSAERTQDDLERLADSLRYVGTVPHLGMVPPDPVFWRIVDGGLEIVPYLIDRMTDTREIPELYVKYFGGVYTVADVAYVALQEIIADIPTFDLLGVPYSEMYGYNVYWWHVRESRRNRRNFRRAVRGWYEENRDNLVWVEWHLSLTGDTNFAPSKGHYVVKGNDILDLNKEK